MAQCPAHGSRVDEGQTSPLSRARSLYENRVRLTAPTCACRSTRRSAVRFRVLADEPIEKSLMRGSASRAIASWFAKLEGRQPQFKPHKRKHTMDLSRITTTPGKARRACP